jgi:Domain of unknown function (DUF4743)
MLKIAKLANNSLTLNNPVYFLIDAVKVGIVSPKAVSILKSNHSDDFKFTPHLEFKSSLSVGQRTELLANVLQKWREDDLFDCLKGWRNEVTLN